MRRITKEKIEKITYDQWLKGREMLTLAFRKAMQR